MTLFDQHLFYTVLDLLNGGDGEPPLHKQIAYLSGELERFLVVGAAHRLCCLVDSVGDLLDVEGNLASVTLSDLDYHFFFLHIYCIWNYYQLLSKLDHNI